MDHDFEAGYITAAGVVQLISKIFENREFAGRTGVIETKPISLFIQDISVTVCREASDGERTSQHYVLRKKFLAAGIGGAGIVAPCQNVEYVMNLCREIGANYK